MNWKTIVWAGALFIAACDGSSDDKNQPNGPEAPADPTDTTKAPVMPFAVTIETARYNHLATETTLTWTKFVGKNFSEYRIYAETGSANWKNAPEVTSGSTLVSTIDDVGTLTFTVEHSAEPAKYSYYSVYAFDTSGQVSASETVVQTGLHLYQRAITYANASCPDGIQFKSNGNVLVADYSLEQVFEFGPSGTFIRTYGDDRNNDPYYGLELANGNILVSGYGESDPSEIAVYGAGGAFLYASASSGPGLPYIAPNGAMYIPLYDVNKIAYYAPGSTVPTSFWGGFGSGPGQYDQIWEIWGDGVNLFVLDPNNNRIQVLDLNGNYVREFGNSGAYRCESNQCWGMAISQNGLVYVVNDVYGILVYRKNGDFVDRIPPTRYGEQWSWGANFSANGEFYLARCATDADVLVFGP